MNNRNFILILLFFEITSVNYLFSQSSWPSKSWSEAINLNSVLNSGNGVLEMSGLFWNPELKRLYAVSDNGGLLVLKQNTIDDTFTQLASITGLNGPEGIMQDNYTSNEFYTIDEKKYQIRKYSHSSDFSTYTLSNSWNLLDSPSPMTDTDNTGPEGITFIPDQYLISIGFISTATGNVYKSKKGMGGLVFIAHQKKGYVWVFDLNPGISNDFEYVGKYKTNEDESCDLSFDRSTGLLYILHNTGDNYLEVTDMSTTIVSGERKFVVKKEYNIPNPSGNDNIEGFAITPKFADSSRVSVWLCRDVESGESTSYQKDCLRRFTPFKAEGVLNTTAIHSILENSVQIGPNPAGNYINISFSPIINSKVFLKIYTLSGQLCIEKNICSGSETIDISVLNRGVYLIELNNDFDSYRSKIIKK